MADTTATRRFRVYFEERSQTELIVRAASADEAKAQCKELFRNAEDQFKVRTNASDWMVEDLGQAKN